MYARCIAPLSCGGTHSLDGGGWDGHLDRDDVALSIASHVSVGPAAADALGGGGRRLEPKVIDGTATPAASDIRITKTGYDPILAGDTSGWTLRLATTQTTVMGGGQPDVVARTRYDALGRVVETRMPASTGNDAGTTYYTAATNTMYPECGGKPHSAGLTCRTGPKAQPAGPPIPVTTTTYDYGGVGDRVVAGAQLLGQQPGRPMCHTQPGRRRLQGGLHHRDLVDLPRATRLGPVIQAAQALGRVPLLPRDHCRLGHAHPLNDLVPAHPRPRPATRSGPAAPTPPAPTTTASTASEPHDPRLAPPRTQSTTYITIPEGKTTSLTRH